MKMCASKTYLMILIYTAAETIITFNNALIVSRIFTQIQMIVNAIKFLKKHKSKTVFITATKIHASNAMIIFIQKITNAKKEVLIIVKLINHHLFVTSARQDSG